MILMLLDDKASLEYCLLYYGNLKSGSVFSHHEQLWTAHYWTSRKWQDNILSYSEQVP